MNYRKCGLTEYIFMHDKLQHAIIIVLGVVVVLRLLDGIMRGVNFKTYLKLVMSKVLILVICFFTKIIDFLTISNELIYDIVVTFYIFESTCEIFLLGKEYGLPLPSKLQELMTKYIVE